MKYCILFISIFNGACFASQGQSVVLYQWPNGDRPVWQDKEYDRCKEREKIPLLCAHCPQNIECKTVFDTMNKDWRNCLYSCYVHGNQSRRKASKDWKYFDEVCGHLTVKDLQQNDKSIVERYLEEVERAHRAFDCIKTQDNSSVIASDGSTLAQPLMFLYGIKHSLGLYEKKLRELADSGELRKNDEIRLEDLNREDQLLGLINKQNNRIKVLEDEILKKNGAAKIVHDCLYALGGGAMIGFGFVLFQYVYMRMLILLAQSV